MDSQNINLALEAKKSAEHLSHELQEVCRVLEHMEDLSEFFKDGDAVSATVCASQKVDIIHGAAFGMMAFVASGLRAHLEEYRTAIHRDNNLSMAGTREETI